MSRGAVALFLVSLIFVLCDGAWLPDSVPCNQLPLYSLNNSVSYWSVNGTSLVGGPINAARTGYVSGPAVTLSFVGIAEAFASRDSPYTCQDQSVVQWIANTWAKTKLVDNGTLFFNSTEARCNADSSLVEIAPNIFTQIVNVTISWLNLPTIMTVSYSLYSGTDEVFIASFEDFTFPGSQLVYSYKPGHLKMGMTMSDWSWHDDYSNLNALLNVGMDASAISEFGFSEPNGTVVLESILGWTENGAPGTAYYNITIEESLAVTRLDNSTGENVTEAYFVGGGQAASGENAPMFTVPLTPVIPGFAIPNPLLLVIPFCLHTSLKNMTNIHYSKLWYDPTIGFLFKLAPPPSQHGVNPAAIAVPVVVAVIIIAAIIVILTVKVEAVRNAFRPYHQRSKPSPQPVPELSPEAGPGANGQGPAETDDHEPAPTTSQRWARSALPSA